MSFEVPHLVADSTAVIGLTLAVITLISTVLALLWKAFKIHAQVQDVMTEFKPNHGGSLRDQIDAVRLVTEANAQQIATHIEHSETAMDAMDRNNTDAHGAIHRRIDGLFTLLAGPNAARMGRVGDFHASQRSSNEEGSDHVDS